jgi:hypothetical protein
MLLHSFLVTLASAGNNQIFSREHTTTSNEIVKAECHHSPRDRTNKQVYSLSDVVNEQPTNSTSLLSYQIIGPRNSQ